MQQGKKIVEPAYLKAGDKVAIVSPAYWIPQDAIQMAANVIRSWGLVPVIGPHTKDLNVNAYAGTADQRAAVPALGIGRRQQSAPFYQQQP